MNEEIQDFIEVDETEQIEREAEAIEKTKVYIETDENNHIIKVFSSDFREPTATSILIDEGNGDKYRHAQSQYFDKPLRTQNGDYIYEYVDGRVREKDQTKNRLRRERECRIAELKLNLAETDYKAIKYAEGIISEDEYAETKVQRQAWRDEINVIEASL